MIYDKHGLLKVHYFLHLGGIYRALLEDDIGLDPLGNNYDLKLLGLSGTRATIYNTKTGEVRERTFSKTHSAKKWLTNMYKNMNNI